MPNDYYGPSDLNGQAGLDDLWGDNVSIQTDLIHYCYTCELPFQPDDSDSAYPNQFCSLDCQVEYGPITEEDPPA